MTIPALDTAAVGQPITRLGVSFFPVYLPGNRVPRIAAGPKSGLVVGELENPSVPQLKAENPTDAPILVIEGEHFFGGLQDRAANATVLVPPYTTVEIPVTCLEAGRWGERCPGAPRTTTASRHERGHRLAPPEVRRNVRASVSHSYREEAGHRVDQGAAWRAVAETLHRQERTPRPRRPMRRRTPRSGATDRGATRPRNSRRAVRFRGRAASASPTAAASRRSRSSVRRTSSAPTGAASSGRISRTRPQSGTGPPPNALSGPCAA